MGKIGLERRYEGYGRSLVEFQAVVLASFLVLGTALLLSRPHTLEPLLYSAGATVLLVVTASTVVWRQNALFQRFSLVLPLVDIVGIRLTMMADSTELSGGALLLIFPTVWIAYSFGPWGFAMCLALLAVTSPQGFFESYTDFDSIGFTRLIAFPLTVVVMASAAGVSGARIRRKRAELAAQTVLTERAVLARDDLIEAVTHELRTPLTSILGNAELMLRQCDQPQKMERRAGVIVRNAEQIDVILSDLLLARSTDTSQFGLRRVATDMRALVDTCIAASRATADAREITLSVSVTGPVWVEVDPNRIRQVLDNLLTNAIKYNRVGGTVAVSETRNAGFVTLAVTDSGTGIADVDHERVFEPYYRTESARSSSQAGTGLGLGISREIARRHGGDLSLAESSRAGSRFVLHLPLAPQSSLRAAG
jgi:signal transduction histidine kinase